MKRTELNAWGRLALGTFVAGLILTLVFSIDDYFGEVVPAPGRIIRGAIEGEWELVDQGAACGMPRKFSFRVSHARYPDHGSSSRSFSIPAGELWNGVISSDESEVEVRCRWVDGGGFRLSTTPARGSFHGRGIWGDRWTTPLRPRALASRRDVLHISWRAEGRLFRVKYRRSR